MMNNWKYVFGQSKGWLPTLLNAAWDLSYAKMCQ